MSEPSILSVFLTGAAPWLFGAAQLAFIDLRKLCRTERRLERIICGTGATSEERKLHNTFWNFKITEDLPAQTNESDDLINNHGFTPYAAYRCLVPRGGFDAVTSGSATRPIVHVVTDQSEVLLLKMGLAADATDDHLQLFDGITGSKRFDVTAGGLFMAISSAGQMIATTRKTELLDGRNGRPLYTFSAADDARFMSFSSDGNIAAVRLGSADLVFFVYEAPASPGGTRKLTLAKKTSEWKVHFPHPASSIPVLPKTIIQSATFDTGPRERIAVLTLRGINDWVSVFQRGQTTPVFEVLLPPRQFRAAPMFVRGVVFARDVANVFSVISHDNVAVVDMVSGVAHAITIPSRVSRASTLQNISQLALSHDGTVLAVLAQYIGVRAVLRYDVATRQPLGEPQVVDSTSKLVLDGSAVVYINGNKMVRKSTNTLTADTTKELYSRVNPAGNSINTAWAISSFDVGTDGRQVAVLVDREATQTVRRQLTYEPRWFVKLVCF